MTTDATGRTSQRRVETQPEGRRATAVRPRRLVGRDCEIVRGDRERRVDAVDHGDRPGWRWQDGAGDGRSGRVGVRSFPMACSSFGWPPCGPRSTSQERWPRRSGCRGQAVRPTRMRSPTGWPNVMSCSCSTTASTWCPRWPISWRVSPRGFHAFVCSRRAESRCGPWTS